MFRPPVPALEPTQLEPSATRRVQARHGPAYRIVALAARVLGVADATLTLVDGGLQGVLATTRRRLEADDELAERLSEVVAAARAAVVVPDLSTTEHPALDGRQGTGVYVGVPLLDRTGFLVGVLYLTDPTPRPVPDHDVQLVTDFAAVAADHLDLTRRANELESPGEQGIAALARAISHGEIVPWYQPIVDLATGRLVGVEALARWEDPRGTLEHPLSFIALAERSNLIVDLDRLVIRQALHDLGRWQVRHPTLRLNVNLSGRHLDLDDWVQVVQELVSSAGIRADTVSLELTETARPAAGLDLSSIAELRAAGFQVWFDDFGSGWAALQELVTFPLDGLKIDRSFAAELGHHVDDTIVKAIATAGNELGLRVTMEGIETPEQAGIAARLGCHYGQGFLWSQPLPAERLEALISTPDGRLPRLP